MLKYVLPSLDYDYAALEPHISARIMELHHQKHHATYVKSANEVLEKLDQAREKGDTTTLAALERQLAFNLSGHVLHSIFWRNLMPKAAPKPDGELAKALDRDFGSFDKFKAQMNGVAGSIMGSGWAALVWEPLSKRLLITQIYDHQSNLNQAGIPLMLIDAWEHAYYLQYENRKADFFAAIWNCWNWKDIGARLTAATKVDVGIPNTVKEAA